MANAEETRCILNRFNTEFATSKKELIGRFLKDQEELNRRFEEYALLSDSDNDNSKHRQNSGLNPHLLSKHLQNTEIEDDRDSVNSVQTEYGDDSGSETECHVNIPTRPQPPSGLKPTPPEQDSSERMTRVCRSQSMRIANKFDLASLKRAPQPPNSPEIRDDEDKPPLDGLRPGRRASLRDSKRRPPKKLLSKRSERPKSALGYQKTSLSLVGEDPCVEDKTSQDDGNQDSAYGSITGSALPSRSAPSFKNRVLNWDTDVIKSVDHAKQDQIPDLHTPRDLKNRVPSYAHGPVVSQPRSHVPNAEPVESNSFHRATSIRQPIKKRMSESTMYANPQPTKESLYRPNHHSRVHNMPLHDPGYSRIEPSNNGGMRRYKGQGNLAEQPLTPRGSQLAVLKLPPVTKKKSYPTTEMPNRAGTSLSFFNTSEAF